MYVATSVSIQTNFKPDLISFLCIAQWSRLSLWLTILSQQLRLLLCEISLVRFHLDRIHSVTDFPELCWVYTGTVSPWNGIVPPHK